MRATVFGIFQDWKSAHRALERLNNAGFSAQETNVLGPHGLQDPAVDTDSTRYFSGTTHGSVEDGATVGAVAGAAFGGAAGWALGLTLLAVPGLGPLMIAGPILTGLAGFVAGAGAGGFIGSLTGMGIPEKDANLYHEHVTAGRIVIAVPNTDRPEEAQTLMESAGALETHRHAATPLPTVGSTPVGGDVQFGPSSAPPATGGADRLRSPEAEASRPTARQGTAVGSQREADRRLDTAPSAGAAPWPEDPTPLEEELDRPRSRSAVAHGDETLP